MRANANLILLLPILISLSCTLPTQGAGTPPPVVIVVTNPQVTKEAVQNETATFSPLPTQTTTPTNIPTATFSPTPSVPTALFLMNANCRSKPDKNSEALMSFLIGDTAEIVGRNNELDNTWWYVKMPDSKYKCWVSTITVDVIGSYDDIPTLPTPY